MGGTIGGVDFLQTTMCKNFKEIVCSSAISLRRFFAFALNNSIINGFAMPLKREHLHFLNRALIPLHKPKCVALYHQQLTYCIVQYVEKDPETAVNIIEGITQAWPWSCSAKQVVFFNELEEILELIGPEQLQRVHGELLGVWITCCAVKALNNNPFL